MIRRAISKKYASGVVHPVGGKVDLGENPYSAAVREVYEETGLKVANLKLKAVLLEIEPHLNEPYNWLIFHFTADYTGGEIKSTEEGQLIWLSESQIKQEKLFPSVKAIVEYIFDNQKETVFATFKYDEQKQSIIEQTIDFSLYK